MRTILLTASAVLIGTLLVACEDMDSQKKPSKAAVVKIFKQETTLKGLVSNDKGRIKEGKVQALSLTKKIIASSDVQSNGHYEVKIPENTALPILLKVIFEPDSEQKIELTAAVIYNSMTKFDINPLSTKIAKKAKKLGGYTHPNMLVAAESMVKMPDDNKSTQGFRGDPTKQYGGWH
ncbi:MAG: hypothetical protein KAG06_00040 [Methylococcales bacterium]|nr:hypothetical protein [Methylococcales bacterium]